MKRKPFSLLVKEWISFGLVIVPFLLLGLRLNVSDLSELFTEFMRFVVGAPVLGSAFGSSVFPVLLMIAISGSLISGVVGDVITPVIGFARLDASIKDLFESSPLKAGLTFIILVATEEAVFRGFFLWVLPHLFSSPRMLFALVLLSNAVFAFLHMGNFKGSTRIFRVIPIFLISFFLAFTFLKYGLFASFLVHLFHDCICFFHSRLFTVLFGKHPIMEAEK